MPDYQVLLKDLPSVDRLLQEPLVKEKLHYIPRRIVLEAARETLEDYRVRIMQDSDLVHDKLSSTRIDLSTSALSEEVALLAENKAGFSLKALINATGVVIHTNLGRVPLAGSAVRALSSVSGSYSNLEFSLDSGERGSRQAHLEKLLCDLSGAEAAVVLNNNAAAVFLALNTIAFNREVVVSRGQLVEIGGSFRIPEIITAGGARLVEVGTTNKTHLSDYDAAVNDNTAAFLKVHTSNYHMIGFTSEVGTGELSTLASKYEIPLIEDLGSGVFLDTSKYNLPPEPRVTDSIKAGADLVTFSGDKMLGGPQAGIIVGREDLISQIRKNQLARVLRVDKLTVAAMEATLRLYLDETVALKEIPVWNMLTVPKVTLRKRASQLEGGLVPLFGRDNIKVVEGVSKVGGGALPSAELPTYLVVVKPSSAHPSVSDLTRKMRQGEPPVILRLRHDSLVFDPRTVGDNQLEALTGAVKKALE